MKFWPFKARETSLPSLRSPDGVTGADGMPTMGLRLDRLAPSGRNFDLSREALDLLAALRAADAHEAMFRAFRLHRLARDGGFPDTQEAAETLEIALVCCETCQASPVPAAAAHLVRTMVLDGLLHAIAVPGHRATDGTQAESLHLQFHPDLHEGDPDPRIDD